ncbi:early nodulin-like protein 3 [Nicotiana tabacum]|uniref:Early nodulin-like protein 3 n=1 Tax=Nicotiana tabacum TaxID=4097 RepID=A0A1S4CS23_TOBAC
MESLFSLSSFFLIFLGFMCSCEAYTFYAGGTSGWVLNPTESYSHWSDRNRFQVNDTIIFKFKIGSDSVLIVDQDDYSKCNKDKPIRELKHGDSKIKLYRSGPFYFISGHEDNCEKGQKLKVVVLSPNHKAHNALSPVTEPIGSVSPAPSPAQSAAGFTVSPSGFLWGFSLMIAAYICILV